MTDADQAAAIELVQAALRLGGLQNADNPNGDVFIAALDAFEELVMAITLDRA
jgi:hypothetical protein